MTTTDESGLPTGEKVLPFYIVCDESASMHDNGGIDAINQSLPELHATISADPLVNDKTRIALIAFSSTAEVLVPLAAAADIGEMPGVDAAGATDYGSVFQLLKAAFLAEAKQVCYLKKSRKRVLRLGFHGAQLNRLSQLSPGHVCNSLLSKVNNYGVQNTACCVETFN